ncbi:YodC family protein [Massilia soli]|uniref:DUF2158 domain-containing protein n=1 Tax=Massilia soli TaxID=2792854 RepID=A0ABS7SRC0_9BURK|nr:DUF2158 domain-containing protein [Massilia soli]
MNHGVFHQKDLIACYATPNLRSVMPGNRVMLRSGGPEMTVAGTDSQGRAICQWMSGGVLQSLSFDLECLTCYGAR